MAKALSMFGFCLMCGTENVRPHRMTCSERCAVLLAGKMQKNADMLDANWHAAGGGRD